MVVGPFYSLIILLQVRQKQTCIGGGGGTFLGGSRACPLGKFLNIDPWKQNFQQFEQLFSMHFAVDKVHIICKKESHH